MMEVIGMGVLIFILFGAAAFALACVMWTVGKITGQL